jgi:hypothetical protein
MSKNATQALDRLAHQFAGDVAGKNPSRDELIVAAFLEMREQLVDMQRQLTGSPPARVSDDDGYVSLLVAARQIGRSNEYLRQRAVKGKIDAVFQDGKWLVKLDALDAFRRR